MATVTGLTAERMLEIEAESVVDGDVVGGNLILTRHDGTSINAGPVIGPQGPVGPPGVGIPGEIRLWPGDVVPDPATYGLWVWANGDPYNVVDYPKAAANISPNWKTANGLADPGAGRFRVPDLRGLVPAGLDAMGGARANRVTRPEAIALAKAAGEERHKLIATEMPAHAHGGRTNAVDTLDGGVDHSHTQNVHTHGPGASTNFMTGAGGTYTPGTTAPGPARYLISAAPASTAGQSDRGMSGASSIAHRHNVPSTGVTVDPNGGDLVHENLQPTIFVPYIVKLDG